jgi:hypothetical protein
LLSSGRLSHTDVAPNNRLITHRYGSAWYKNFRFPS